MASFKIISMLAIVILALFAETYASLYFLEDVESAGAGQRLVRLRRSPNGVTGPVHTYVKTDKHANFKWGVRHHVGHKYAGH